MHENITGVEYNCPHCDTDFWVYHRNDDRNDMCIWCGNKVVQTGIHEKLVGNDIVTYKDGVEINRFPKRG